MNIYRPRPRVARCLLLDITLPLLISLLNAPQADLYLRFIVFYMNNACVKSHRCWRRFVMSADTLA